MTLAHLKKDGKGMKKRKEKKGGGGGERRKQWNRNLEME
jgi:hypothetical protein